MEINAYKQIERFAQLELPVTQQGDHHIVYNYNNESLYLFDQDSEYFQTYTYLDLVKSIPKAALELPVIGDSGKSGDLYYLIVAVPEATNNDSMTEADLKSVAVELAQFFIELKKIDCQPVSKASNKAVDFNNFIDILRTTIEKQPCGNDRKVYNDILLQGLESLDQHENTLIFGRLDCSDLVIENSHLVGITKVATPYYGDDSYNLAIGYRCFDKESREIFFETLGCDEQTKKRARNWALYQALGAAMNDDPAALKTLYHIFEEYYG